MFKDKNTIISDFSLPYWDWTMEKKGYSVFTDDLMGAMEDKLDGYGTRLL